MKAHDRPYQLCTRCVMDTSAGDIEFDSGGVCSYCREFIERCGEVLDKRPEQRARELEAFVARVKGSGQGRRYDCVVGVSGGVDSSWALVQAVRLGLRPLAVHLDNGWNSELAQNNISNLVTRLGVDLHTHVIDWPEYKGLMQAFFDADVIDVELLYDNAMLAANYEAARKNGIRFMLSGWNKATEGMRIPKDWNWFKYDRRNIEAISRRFGGPRLKSFPAFGTLGFILHEKFLRIRWIQFLDHFDYNKAAALETLQSEYGYKPYLYKHYESIFTRFYQGYILPEKFGVDKRRMHLSSLVVTRQLSRDAALESLSRIPYPSQAELEADKQYFLKKMGWTAAQLEDYLRRPEKPHTDYPSEKPLWDFLISRKKKRKG